MEFEVNVEKRMTVTGTVKVSAETHSEAVRKVQAQINNGELNTSNATWDDPEYEDCSFQVNDWS